MNQEVPKFEECGTLKTLSGDSIRILEEVWESPKTPKELEREIGAPEELIEDLCDDRLELLVTEIDEEYHPTELLRQAF